MPGSKTKSSSDAEPFPGSFADQFRTLTQEINKLKSASSINETVADQMKSLKKEIGLLKEENTTLHLKVQSLTGNNVRLEREIKKIRQETEDLQTKSMSKNLVFYNIAEEKGEDLEKKILKEIDSNKILTTKERDCNTMIDITYRMGPHKIGKTRPVVVQFMTQKSADLIRKGLSNIPKDSKLRVADQLPREVNIRRAVQISTLKTLRQEHPTAKIILKRDKLLVNGAQLDPGFESNPLLPNVESKTVLTFDDVDHTNVHTEQKSAFQGYAVGISSLQEARAAYESLLQNQFSCEADHLIYAYAVKDPGSNITMYGHNDDREWSAGQILSGLLKTEGTQNVLIAVARKYGGQDMGPLRFKVIKKVAKEALELAISEECKSDNE